MKMLVVFDADMRIEKVTSSCMRGNENAFYLFSLTSCEAVRNGLRTRLEDHGPVAEVIDTAAAIDRAAQGMRGQYIRFISEVPLKVKWRGRNLREFFAVDDNASLWWFGDVAVKNTLKSDAFNALVRLDAIIRVIKERSITTIIWGCGDRKLKRALRRYAYAENIGFLNIPIKGHPGIKRYIKNSQQMLYVKHMLYLCNFALRYLFRTIMVKNALGRTKRPPMRDKELVILTYYPNFDTELARKDGIFKNRYYPHLQEALEGDRKDMAWIAMYVEEGPLTLNESLDFARLFTERGCALWFLEEFVSVGAQVRAILKIMLTGLRFMTIQKRIAYAHRISDYNFYDILRDEWYASFVGADGYSGLLHYYAFSSLFRRFEIKTCLYYCEMLGWEKALASARNVTRNLSRLLGYQHATVSRMLLNYFNDPSEIEDKKPFSLPIPDRIICNGRLPYRYMRESGWPEKKLSIAEAIRYTHLKYCKTRERNKHDNVVTVVFSISCLESSAILNHIYQSLIGLDGVKVKLRPHPFLPLHQILNLCGIERSAIPFQIDEKPLNESLSETKILIAGESGISVQALAFGCELILVNIPEYVNMSPLRGVEDRVATVTNSSEELKRAIKDARDYTDISEEKRNRKCRILNEFFYFNEMSDVPTKLLELVNTNGG